MIYMLVIDRLVDFFKDTEFHMAIGYNGCMHKVNALCKVDVNIAT